MQIKINDTNYEYFKQIFQIICFHHHNLYFSAISGMPDATEKFRMLELKSKSLAKRVIKATLQDMISQIKEFPLDLKAAIDKDLAKNNLPSLQELSGANLKIINQVLKRGKVISLEEFYIVKEEVVDLTTVLSESERQLLDKALSDFESSKSTKH